MTDVGNVGLTIYASSIIFGRIYCGMHSTSQSPFVSARAFPYDHQSLVQWTASLEVSWVGLAGRCGKSPLLLSRVGSSAVTGPVRNLDLERTISI